MPRWGWWTLALLTALLGGLVLVGTALAIDFEPTPGCQLESAFLAFIPPGVIRVMLTEVCGPITCWRRWLELDGRRIGETRVCETQSRRNGSPLVVP